MQNEPKQFKEFKNKIAKIEIRYKTDVYLQNRNLSAVVTAPCTQGVCGSYRKSEARTAYM